MNERAVEGDEALGAVAVGHDHEQAVGDAVADDDLLPQRLGVEVGVVGLGADGGRVDEHLGAAEGVEPRDLGEPLVPAGRQPEPQPPGRRARTTG